MKTKPTIVALVLLSSQAWAQQKSRVELLGNDVYSSKRLTKVFRLTRYRTFSKSRVSVLKKQLRRYYLRRGYIHTRVYIARYSKKAISLYIDEGKLGRIIFHNVGAFDIIRMRRDFKLPGKAYHRARIRRNLKSMKKKYKLRRIYSKLRPSKDFDRAKFQINRDLEFLRTKDSPFREFTKPQPRFELHVYVTKRKQKEKGFHFGVRLNFVYGLIPYVKYKHPDLYKNKDRLEVDTSLGVFYGFDFAFKKPPRWSWARIAAEYDYAPIFDGFITPQLRTSFQRTQEEREDIGLDRYTDMRIRGTIGPGFRVIKGTSFHAAYGAEGIFLAQPRLEDDASTTTAPTNGFLTSEGGFRDGSESTWQIVEFRLEVDLEPLGLKYDIKPELKIGYNIFLSEFTFNKFFFTAKYAYEFENYDLYSLALNHVQLFIADNTGNDSIPFYYEEKIDGRYFRGFIGRNYHTRSVWRLTNEYRTSLYQDFIFGGLFFDITVFQGSGYDLTGLQAGIVGGISLHFLILDQFNFDLYFGRDVIFNKVLLEAEANEASQFNLYVLADIKF